MQIILTIGHQDFLCKDTAKLNRIIKAFEGVKRIGYLRSDVLEKHTLMQDNRFIAPVKLEFKSVADEVIKSLPKNVSETDLI